MLLIGAGIVRFWSPRIVWPLTTTRNPSQMPPLAADAVAGASAARAMAAASQRSERMGPPLVGCPPERSRGPEDHGNLRRAVATGVFEVDAHHRGAAAEA